LLSGLFFHYHPLVCASFFVSDLHGKIPRYEKLFAAISRERPEAIFIGGDILPPACRLLPPSPDFPYQDFVKEFLVKRLIALREELRDSYPRIFLIMGNDDCRSEEAALLDAMATGVWEYLHNRRAAFREFSVYGYSYVPPTPFQLKDWERYDVSRHIDPGAVSPQEGVRTVPVSDQEMEFSTIRQDLERLAGEDDMDKAILLFHAPPYRTNLDLSALEGVKVDHAPVDPHLGSIAVRRFIENRQPLLTLHGHVHESAELTRSWKDLIGRTRCFSAAHEGPELALVRFAPDDLDSATRELIY
jgi:Icc-related predicted phosphoesterase